MPHRSTSSRRDQAATRPAPNWLEAQVYAPRRQRTVALTVQAVDVLRAAKQPVSLARIAAQSKALDPTGRGVSESAVANNPEARAYYERYRTAVGPYGGRPRVRRPTASIAPAPPRIKPDRDVARARRRYLRLGKEELVERLLAVEQAYAEQEERWRQANDELLLYRLRTDPIPLPGDGDGE